MFLQDEYLIDNAAVSRTPFSTTNLCASEAVFELVSDLMFSDRSWTVQYIFPDLLNTELLQSQISTFKSGFTGHAKLSLIT